jgi:hypothetical protein
MRRQERDSRNSILKMTDVRGCRITDSNAGRKRC